MVRRDVETRFGGVRGNKPKPGGAGTGSWKKSETKRKQFEDITNMTLEQFKALEAKEEHTVFERLAIKAVRKSLNDAGFDIDGMFSLIDGFEPKPAQKVEVASLPTPEPLVHVRQTQKRKATK